MKPTTRCWLLLSLCIYSLSAYTQSFDFKIYDINEGLPQNYIYAIEQDKHGFVWLATGDGLVRYDGIEYELFGTNDSLAHDFIRCIHIDRKDRLWLGHKNGFITYKEKGQFNKVKVEGANKDIFDISEDPQGNIWAVDQRNGLIRFNQDDLTSQTFFNRRKYGRKKYTSVLPITPHLLIVGTTNGLYTFKFSNDFNEVEISSVPDIPKVWIESIVKRRRAENEYWIGTKDEGFFFYSFDNKSSRHITDNNLCRKFNVDNEVITDIYEEPEGHLLIGTQGNGVIKLIYDPAIGDFSDSFKYSTINGLNKDDVEDILCDREGNYWFGTDGGGVALLINQYFIFYDLANEDLGFRNQKAHSVYKDENGLWIGLDKGLLLADPLCFTNTEYYNPQFGGIPDDKIIDFYKSFDETFWVATENNGLYYRKKEHKNFKKYSYSDRSLALKINDISGFREYIYLATPNGLYILNTKTKSKNHIDMSDGLPHNNLNFVHIDRYNNLWIGPKECGICKITLGDTENEISIERNPLIDGAIDVSDMTEDMQGQIWLATRGKGVIYYSTDSLKAITVNEGLKKNYCSSISCDVNNRLWVCHQGGLSRIDVATGTIKIYGHEDEMGSEFHQAMRDEDGNMWFASSQGVVNYLPNNDQVNNVAPILNLINIKLNDEDIPITRELNLPYPYGDGYYNLRLDFRAISFDKPEGVRYEIRINELNEESKEKNWNDLENNSYKEIDYLRHGNYKIRIRAYNADNISTSLPLTISVNVEKPYWLTIWFFILCTITFVLLIYGFSQFNSRRHIRQKLKFKRAVDSQTVQIREQKEEIERKNQDITDSINYAKRIQSSILPSLTDLMTEFPQSFVYFLPRDIVSGDFYWFNSSKDYFIACCADCTGHGVPGAFMSMIGTTILNDIFRLPEVDSPAALLERLDTEIKKLLQTNNGSESNDGMDISIVEIHKTTKKVRLASAKRPVYLIIDNELSVYKGSRRSIGDSYQVNLSPYMNIEYNCAKGDQVFMFSDGYPDQFGGPLGKKFMKMGVQNLIHEIYELSGEEQYKRVQHNFETWRGNLEQIDDVLFMGIKL